MEALWILWPIVGWFCAVASTPKWRLKDPFAWVLLIFCGAIVGPFGVVWFCDGTGGK